MSEKINKSVNYSDMTVLRIQKLADDRFRGNFSMAADFVSNIGLDKQEADEAEKDRISAGKTQIDKTAMAEASA